MTQSFILPRVDRRARHKRRRTQFIRHLISPSKIVFMPIRQSFIPTPAGKMEMSIPHSPAGFKRESRFGELPPPVGGPPARDFIGRWAGRDRRDHRDRRECGMGALARHVIDQREANVARYWPVRSKCCPPLASAERILPRRAIGQCEARKPFHGAKHHPRHLPVVPVVSVVPAQAPVARSGFAPFQPLVRAFPCAARMAAFPVSPVSGRMAARGAPQTLRLLSNRDFLWGNYARLSRKG